MQFRAIKKAFYNASRVYPGQVFDAPDDFEARWAEPVTDVAEKAEIADDAVDEVIDEPVKKPDKKPAKG